MYKEEGFVLGGTGGGCAHPLHFPPRLSPERAQWVLFNSVGVGHVRALFIVTGM